MVFNTDLQLYHLTLQGPTAITNAIQGNFTGLRSQEIVVSRGRILELLKVEDKCKLKSMWSSDVFGLIRSMVTFRLTGSSKDYLVIGSDSGRVVVLEYNTTKNEFQKIHQETFGKSGIRRIVPGQYLVADPKGRAFMIAAIEKSKFVYVLNRDASNNLTIRLVVCEKYKCQGDEFSSPLEAHKSHQICFGLTAVDVGFENPVFASIEQSYENSDKAIPKESTQTYTKPPKTICFWEMDLGLNNVIKKCALPCPDTAHMLVPVPGGSGLHEGPSGVIVCCANHIIYKRLDHPDVACAVPRRLEMPQDVPMFFSCYATHCLRGFFFFLIQSDYGDIYKIELIHEKQGTKRVVTEVICRFFDSIPVANAMCILRSGYLFVAFEFGNHSLYQFTGIGNDKTDPLCSSLHPSGAECTVAFKLRNFRYLTVVDELPSFSPITDMKILDALDEGNPQIYLACGNGPRSSLRILRHGVAAEELADNELPGSPLAVWTLKKNLESEFDEYIIVTFTDSTLILSIGDTVSEVTETSFLRSVSTLHVCTLQDNSFVQVYDNAVRHIHDQHRINEWRPPQGKLIIAATSNTSQICVLFSGGEIVLLELDETNTLVEISRRSLGYEVTSFSLQITPPSQAKAQFLAVGGLDSTVRILSVDPQLELRQLALVVIPDNAQIQSVVLLHIDIQENAGSQSTGLYLFVGLENGVLLRMTVDKVTGELTDQRSRFLGPAPVRLHKIQISPKSDIISHHVIVAASSRPWLCCYTAKNRLECIPIRYKKFDYVASFSSQQCPDGFVAVADRNLRIFQCFYGDTLFSQTIIPLTYTPRKLCVLPPPSPQIDMYLLPNYNENPTPKIPVNQAVLAVIESDHNVYDEATRQEISQALQRIKIDQICDNEESDDMEIKDSSSAPEPETTPEAMPSEQQVGTFRAGTGKWGSCIRIINPSACSVLYKQALDVDETALCSVVCRFWEFDSPCLVIGTATSLELQPRKCSMASVKVYAYTSDYHLTLLHSTPIESPPLALCSWEGRLIVALGKKLRIYALGRKRLLKKCEYQSVPEGVVWLRVVKDRIYAGDMREGFMIFKYKASENQLQFAEESHPHWVTCGEVLDYNTVAGGDKFDSVSVARVPPNSKETDTSNVSINSTLKLRGDTAYLVAECPKFDSIAYFHIGEILTAIQKTTLSVGGLEVLIYTTIMGSIGSLLPIVTKDEISLLQHLEMSMRSASPPLCGRETVVFRSYYFPSKGVIDGDVCEQYRKLPYNQQKSIAEELSRTPLDILKKLEELRNRIL